MIMKNLKIRLKMKRKKPEFVMQGSKNLKRLGKRWRKPRGSHSKLREHKTAKGFLPRTGYGSPRDVKYFHPSGFEEKLIYNSEGLTGIDAQKQACRIVSSVGKRGVSSLILLAILRYSSPHSTRYLVISSLITSDLLRGFTPASTQYFLTMSIFTKENSFSFLNSLTASPVRPKQISYTSINLCLS